MGITLDAIMGHRFNAHDVLSLKTLLSVQAAPQLASDTSLLTDLLRSGYPDLGNDLNWYWHDLEAINKPIDESSLDPEKIWSDHSSISLKGPAGLFLSLATKSCMLRTPERWSTFLTNEQIQAAIRQVCYEVARIVGSMKAIYVPDSGSQKASMAGDLIYEGMSIDEIQEWLKQRYDAPASTLKEIHTSEPRENDGYYVDYFNDISKK